MQTKGNTNPATEFINSEIGNSKLESFLNYKIISFSHYEITPGTLILILLLFLIAYILRRVFKRVLVGNREESNPEYGGRFSIYMILKYIVFVVTFILILQVVGISLNALLVGSAALLVGVGLGLQNIFQDLVSGLFLLFERPIEIGDIIEVDNIVGKIQIIKLRHTVVLDRDGVNLIVPNNKFITEKVINWSHNKEERRFNVNVGVSYNADPAEVTSILKKCAQEHPLIIRSDVEYPIFVRLVNFGDSSLDFELFFWTRHGFIVENTKSELRYQIFEEFAKAGVQIPFPQRDLHIKSGTVNS